MKAGLLDRREGRMIEEAGRTAPYESGDAMRDGAHEEEFG